MYMYGCSCNVRPNAAPYIKYHYIKTRGYHPTMCGYQDLKGERVDTMCGYQDLTRSLAPPPFESPASRSSMDLYM
jgi:hypothetical protein